MLRLDGRSARVYSKLPSPGMFVYNGRSRDSGGAVILGLVSDPHPTASTLLFVE